MASVLKYGMQVGHAVQRAAVIPLQRQSSQVKNMEYVEFVERSA